MKTIPVLYSLLSPASELVTASPEAEIELLFGRHGDDLIYSYVPSEVSNTFDGTNIKLLFGDLFDTSLTSIDLINAAFFAATPTPLLENGPLLPGWSDTFVLGDWKQPYFLDDSDPIELLTTNLFGTQEFAIVFDFNLDEDTLKLHGSPEDYLMVNISELDTESLPGLSALLPDAKISGQAIFGFNQSIPDLIALVLEPPEIVLSSEGSYFNFVGKKPPKIKKKKQKSVIQLGSAGVDIGNAIATDDFGNVYVTGVTSGSLGAANAGSYDVWVAKYNKRGKQKWLRQFGSSNRDAAESIAVDNQGNFYLAGFTYGDLFFPRESGNDENGGGDSWVAKFDSDSNLLWAQQIGTSITGSTSGWNASFDLAVDDDSNVYLSGLAIKTNERQDIYPFPVQDDAWTIKFNSEGDLQWYKTTNEDTPLAPFFFDEAYGIAVDNNGNSYEVGWTQAAQTVADPPQFSSKYDVWLSKINSSGETEWTQQFGSTNDSLDFGLGVITDSNNDIYTAGWTMGDFGAPNLGSGVEGTFADAGSQDVWLAKYSPDGTQQWVRQFGTPERDGKYTGPMAVDSNNNIYLAGYTNGSFPKQKNAGSYDIWVASYDSDGNQRWLEQFGTPEWDYATGISVGKSNNLYLTGYTEGSLGNVNSGATDTWIAKLNANTGKFKNFDSYSRTIVRTPNDDDLSGGTSSNDQISGWQGNNTLSGEASNDLFDDGDFRNVIGSLFDDVPIGNAQDNFTQKLESDGLFISSPGMMPLIGPLEKIPSAAAEMQTA